VKKKEKKKERGRRRRSKPLLHRAGAKARWGKPPVVVRIAPSKPAGPAEVARAGLFGPASFLTLLSLPESVAERIHLPVFATASVGAFFFDDFFFGCLPVLRGASCATGCGSGFSRFCRAKVGLAVKRFRQPCIELRIAARHASGEPGRLFASPSTAGPARPGRNPRPVKLLLSPCPVHPDVADTSSCHCAPPASRSPISLQLGSRRRKARASNCRAEQPFRQRDDPCEQLGPRVNRSIT